VFLQGSWSSEFLSRAAIQANAEMRATTQKIVDALLHSVSGVGS
jgi:hypothetical protein